MKVLLIALPLQLLLSAQPVTGGHFIASLHSNFVVNLDFEGTATQGTADSSDASEADVGETKVMSFAGGKRKFKCNLPGRRNSTNGRSAVGSGLQDRTKFETHFRNAKLAPMKGRCWKWKKDYWTYEVCFGRKITQSNKEAGIHYSLGEHFAARDTLLPSGSVTELYTGGTDNRTSEVRYVCGSSGDDVREFKIVEDQPLRYIILVGGPQFCSWKGEGMEARTEDGKVMLASALLEDMRGSCINMTQGWWTYEYCYPDTLRQYHLQNKVKEPIHTLGTLNGTNAEVGQDKVRMTMVKLKPSASNPRERRAAPSNHRALKQWLGGGAVCDETGKSRSASLQFQCPSNWESRQEPRFVSIQEGQLCEYDVVVHTNMLCGHRKLVPTLPKGKEVIKCLAEPES